MKSGLKKYFPILLIACTVFVLAVVFDNFLQDKIIDPIVLLAWAGWRMISSVDQNIYWTILIAICIYLLFKIFPSEKDEVQNPAYAYDYQLPCRVEQWQILINNVKVEKDGFDNLRKNMFHLYSSITELEDRPCRTDDQAITNKTNRNMPQVIQNLAFTNDGKRNKNSKQALLQLFFYTPKWLRIWALRHIGPDIEYFEDALVWMEHTLGIDNEKQKYK